MKIERRSFFATLFAPLLARFAPKVKTGGIPLRLIREYPYDRALPEGYEEALRYKLAMEMAPMYRTPQARADFQRAYNHLVSNMAEQLAALDADSGKRIQSAAERI